MPANMAVDAELFHTPNGTAFRPQPPKPAQEVPMADSANDHARPLTIAEARALAERLHARAASVVLNDMPELQSDLRHAFRIISEFTNLRRELARTAESTDDVVIRRHLLDLLGQRR
jgi:hypothetical protein